MSIPKSFIKRIKESVTKIALQNPSKEEIERKLKDLYVSYFSSASINKELYFEAAIYLILYRSLLAKYK